MFEPCEEHTGPALSQEALAQFEQEHGIQFPKSLRSELLHSNGGLFPKSQFKINGRIEECSHFRCIAANEAEPWTTFESLHAIVERSGAYQDLLDSLGDLSKVFLFSEHDGSYYFALNFNDRPPSVWSLFLDTDGTGTADRAAASWEEFLALQYDGDEEPTVIFGTGWEQYKILIKQEQSGKNGVQGKILGVRGSTLRFQEETRTGEQCTSREVEWDVTQSRAIVEFTGEGVLVRIEGDGEASSRSSTQEQARWINTEGQDRLACKVTLDSLDDALQLFTEIDGLSSRYGLSARRKK